MCHLSQYQSGLCFIPSRPSLFAVPRSQVPGAQLELRALQVDMGGMRDPAVSMCTAAPGKMDSAYNNDVLLAVFRSKGIAFVLCSSLKTVFRLAIVWMLACISPILCFGFWCCYINMLIQLTRSTESK